MELNKNNGNWEKDAPALAAVERTNPFTVPLNYFENMQDQLQSRMAITESSGEGGNTRFTVPDGYFDTLSDRIMSTVKAESFKKEMSETGFSIPDNYFVNLEESIIKKADALNAAQSKTVRRLIPAWMKYAAAACITAVTGSVIFFSQQNNTLESKLSKIPENDIVTYLQAYSDTGDFPVIIENLEKNIVATETGSSLSDQEIEQYLESTL